MDSKLLMQNNAEIFKALTSESKRFISHLSDKYSFTFQELKFLMDSIIDLNAWKEESLEDKWRFFEARCAFSGKNKKKFILKNIRDSFEKIRSTPLKYPENFSPDVKEPDINYKYVDSKDTIFGYCPARSKKTLCCNLRTIDAVHGCAFGCSYCALKSTYRENTVLFNRDLKSLLNKITLEPGRKYHVGTGQSSDALMWGNKDGMLDILFSYADKNPQILLELKTKSNNISYLLESEVPENAFPSFSLNPEIVIKNEELFTASLDERLKAARALASKGIKVAFHFHPVILFDGWKEYYEKISKRIINDFSPEEIVFISIGTLHYAKPVLKKIRLSGHSSRIFKIPFVSNPEGKLTYPEDIKVEMFRHLYSLFSTFHGYVFFYLCMEEKKFWQHTFGFSYESNEKFENEFLNEIERKLRSKPLPGGSFKPVWIKYQNYESEEILSGSSAGAIAVTEDSEEKLSGSRTEAITVTGHSEEKLCRHLK